MGLFFAKTEAVNWMPRFHFLYPIIRKIKRVIMEMMMMRVMIKFESTSFFNVSPSRNYG